MFCEKCGKQINDDATFCPYCGVSIVNTMDEQAFPEITNITPTTNQHRGLKKVLIAIAAVVVSVALIITGIAVYLYYPFMTHQSKVEMSGCTITVPEGYGLYTRSNIFMNIYDYYKNSKLLNPNGHPTAFYDSFRNNEGGSLHILEASYTYDGDLNDLYDEENDRTREYSWISSGYDIQDSRIKVGDYDGIYAIDNDSYSLRYVVEFINEKGVWTISFYPGNNDDFDSFLNVMKNIKIETQ